MDAKGKEVGDLYALIILDNCGKDLGNDCCLQGSMLHTLHTLFHLIFAINVQDKCVCGGVLFWSFIVAGIRLNLMVTEIREQL